MIIQKEIISLGMADIICDRCKKSCKVDPDLDIFEYSTLEAQWGYGSTRDGENLLMHFCEKCTYELIGK